MTKKQKIYLIAVNAANTESYSIITKDIEIKKAKNDTSYGILTIAINKPHDKIHQFFV